jgi:type II secretory pathway component PulM
MKKSMNQLMIFWQIKSEPEKIKRLLVGACLLLLLISVLWLYPMLKEREQLSQQLPELRHQLVLAYALAQKISQLEDVPIQTTDTSMEAIQKSLTKLGLVTNKVRLDNQVIIIEFKKISFSTLVKWTHDAQVFFQLLVLEASILPLDQLDQVNAILTFKKLH